MVSRQNIRIRARTTLVVSCCKKKKNYNAVVSRQNIRMRLLLFLLFDVNFFVLFCFCKTNFDVFTIFSELSGLERNVLFMEIYTNEKFNPFSNKMCNFYVKKKKKKKKYFNRLQEVLFPQFFSCFECKYVLIALEN